jgi:hypothetical protein
MLVVTLADLAVEVIAQAVQVVDLHLGKVMQADLVTVLGKSQSNLAAAAVVLVQLVKMRQQVIQAVLVELDHLLIHLGDLQLLQGKM